MANKTHLEILKKGVDVWNKWRRENPSIKPDLSYALLQDGKFRERTFTKIYSYETVRQPRPENLSKVDLNGANLGEADLSGANLEEANLSDAYLYKANLSFAHLVNANLSNAALWSANLHFAKLVNANLSGAILIEADLSFVDLSNADCSKANLGGSDLSNSNLSNADFSGANLRTANMIKAKLDGTILNDCCVWGVSAWELEGLDRAEQSNLVITPNGEPTITVDNLEVAQFIYLLLNNTKLRSVIDAITSKVVLILGRFTAKRKAILDELRNELRKQNYLPILFDFEKPRSRNKTETIRTLAGMARFVIADITDAKSIPQELQAIVPNYPSVPIQPIILSSDFEYGMFADFKEYPWVLEVYQYDNVGSLLESLKEKVIVPPENKANEIQKRRV